uniref:Bromo domain-containing protein n=1 Tax=Polytomella parva TaxID=51329 RepID=A0A6U0ZKM8_9CHLO|mmetsp:Transcript_9534/g.17825  ORF Transcript_9534/g.17825 Transcript_9534/m.17825 type:complete len:566 (+) Transcript_9534:55-1752(+)|eukprot:CAMPEP_0175053638 /NCGR_PEP_ID=MMETSP0052_2-20121109/9042_1 /TAXON_ID=51329 ORGANISM="Polytomella parva, Strain SAG 63-3" /NCGR_SAMPLE_ID=MMETSP0052_2 /ASSEMBLY_ACC=CAM_ASM_000194 /LENGTH=565 /DNA_ID=CAMNT_0016318207 /DNA_START=127 /DNA_END=1824 /DNA_ORIENTATION=-
MDVSSRALEALDELQKIGQQRYKINQKIIEKLTKALKANRLKTAVPLSSPSTAPSSSKPPAPQVQKRVGGQLSTPTPDYKKPRLDEVEKRISEIWKKCSNIESRISRKQRAHWFLNPVSEKIVPGYLSVIKQPMDLGTVRQRLSERYYKDVRDFASDMRLIWKNCRTYNQPGQTAYNNGEQCSEEFEKAYAEAGLEQQWDEIQMMKDPQNVSLERRLSVSAKQLAARVNNVTLRPELDPSREMAMVEKRKLSIALGELQGHQIAPVLEIIAEFQSELDLSLDSDTQTELDIDSLNNQTLWKLREYVDGVQARLAGGSGIGTGGNANGGATLGGNKPPMSSSNIGGGGGAGKSIHNNNGNAGMGGGISNNLGGAKPAISGTTTCTTGMGGDSLYPVDPSSLSEACSENNSFEDVKGSNVLGTQLNQQGQQRSMFVKNQRIPPGGMANEGESATPAPKPSVYATSKKSDGSTSVINEGKWAVSEEEEDEGTETNLEEGRRGRKVNGESGASEGTDQRQGVDPKAESGQGEENDAQEGGSEEGGGDEDELWDDFKPQNEADPDGGPKE